jgi:anti-anti-sigma factor
MTLTTDHVNDVAILRVGESRLMYPLLQDFSAAIDALFADGHRKVVLDLSQVGYVDSATIGCLMDAYRQATAAGGRLRLSGVQKRVETMLTMTGSHAFLKMFPDEARAVASFGE